MFKIVKRFYYSGIYTSDNVRMFVMSGKLTAEEYKEITGLDYSAV